MFLVQISTNVVPLNLLTLVNKGPLISGTGRN
jgi:hypothetical protein